MFYSKELLSKQTPLGAIWLVAHGRKLNKNKLMGINIQDICDEVTCPNVPQSLRLQGILVGGIVMVFSRQQTYLLDDVHDMMRRVKNAININVGGKAMLKKGKDKARRDAITLADHDDDNNGLLDQLNNMMMDTQPGLFVDGPHINMNMLPLSQCMPKMTPADLTQLEDEDLFAVPSLSGLSAGNIFDSQPLADRNRPGRKAATKATLALEHRRATALRDHDNEMFAMAEPGDDLLLADELGFGEQLYAGEAGENNNGMLDDCNRRHSIGATANNSLGFGAFASDGSKKPKQVTGAEEGGSSDEEHTATSPLSAEEQAKHKALAANMRRDYDEQANEVLVTEDVGDDHIGHKAAAAAALNKRKRVLALKRKRGTAGIDEPGAIQIPSQEFRQWTLDTSCLLTSRGVVRHGADMLHGNPAAGLLSMDSNYKVQGLMLFQPDIMGSTRPAASLAAVYRHVSMSCNMAGEREEDDPVTGTKARKGAKRARVITTAVGPSTGAAGTEQTEEDQLGALPFGGDIEVERLRAASTTPMGMEAVRGSALRAAEQRLLANTGLGGGSRASSISHMTGSSGPGTGLMYPVRNLQNGRDGSVHGADSSDLLLPDGGMPADLLDCNAWPSGYGAAFAIGRVVPGSDGKQPTMRWGNNTLEDLLPALGLMADDNDILGDLQYDELGRDHPLRAETQSESAGPVNPLAASETDDDMVDVRAGRRAKPHNAGNAAALIIDMRAGMDATMNPSLGTDNVQLLESNGDTLPTQVPMPQLNKNSTTVIKLVQQHIAAQRHAGVQDPAVSFLSLAQQLTRSEAVKLFMQVLVTSTAGMTKAVQDQPFGDILIRTGRRMPAPA